jgi:hypothetical protein
MTKILILFIVLLFSAVITELNAQTVSVQEAWVSNYASDGSDIVQDMTISDSGYVYITGYTTGINWEDYLTIKYDASGNEVWVRTYNNDQANGTDEAQAIAVDDSGNVYVTGISTGNGTNFLTIKYDPSGNTIWTSRYDGPGTFGDTPRGIAADNMGNVYVTGEASGANNIWDIVTIKYGPSGAALWITTYDGPAADYDSPNAMTMGSDGFIYVTGFSKGIDTGFDLALIKYDPSTGQIVWINRYDDPSHFDDSGFALDTDANGNVYVTGLSDFDFITLKYSALTGAITWQSSYTVNLFGRPAAIAVDLSGNVIVGGSYYRTTTKDDYITIKYNSSGVQQWVSFYDYNAYDDDIKSMDIDGSGNIYVTGFASTSDNIFERRAVTVKYNSSGAQQWTEVLSTAGSDGRKVKVDAYGNVYVAGIFGNFDPPTYFDTFTAKYKQVIESVPDALQEAISDINSLPLSSGNKNALKSKLQNALAKYNSGDLNAALNLLNAFLNQLYQYIADGKISQADAQPVIDYVNLIIAAIESQLPKGNAAVIPGESSLSQNYPNPFNPATIISWNLKEAAHVSLKVYDILGNEIAVLVNETKEAGRHAVEFKASNLPSGVYLYRIEVGPFTETRKMILMK